MTDRTPGRADRGAAATRSSTPAERGVSPSEVGTGCVICHRPLGDRPITLRYEMRSYSFDREACKRIFQENPDRYLDANGGILAEPRD